MGDAARRDPDAMELHAIGRLVLGAGLGPRWELGRYLVSGCGEARVEVVTCQETRDTRLLELWSDRGPSTGGARVVAEHFLRELTRLGFRIVRSDA